MNMSKLERAAPPYFLLLILLGFLAMFTASFQSFMNRPDSVKPGSPNARTPMDTGRPMPGAIADLPDGGSNLALTEQQADDLTNLMRRLQTDPKDADALMEIGDAFLMAKDWGRAEVFLKRAVLSRPSDIRPRYMLGICLYKQQKMKEAAATFEELLEIKSDPAAQYNLAIIYKYHLHREDAADALFRQITTLPDADMDTVNRAERELNAE